MTTQSNETPAQLATKLYKVEITLMGESEEVPVYATSLDDALEQAEAAYGPDTVGRVRPTVVPQ